MPIQILIDTSIDVMLLCRFVAVLMILPLICRLAAHSVARCWTVRTLSRLSRYCWLARLTFDLKNDREVVSK